MRKENLEEYGMTRGKPTPVSSQPNVKNAADNDGSADSEQPERGDYATSKSAPKVTEPVKLDKTAFEKGHTVVDKDGQEVGTVVSAAGEVPKPDVVIVKTPDGKLVALDDGEEYQLQTEETVDSYIDRRNPKVTKKFYPKTQGAVMQAAARIENMIDALSMSIDKWDGMDQIPDHIRKRYVDALAELNALSRRHGIDEEKRFRDLMNKLNSNTFSKHHPSKAKNILGKFEPKLATPKFAEAKDLVKILDLPLEQQIKKLERITEGDINYALQQSKPMLKEALDKKHKDGTYSSFIVSDECKEKLLDWCKENDVTCTTEDKIHCTIIHSKTPVPALSEFDDTDIDVTAKITEWEILGPEKDCLVLRIESNEVNKINEMMMEAGATSDYDEFKPHVTINFEWEGNPPKSTPDFDLTFDKVEVVPLENNYYDKDDKEDVKEGAVPPSDPVRAIKVLMARKLPAGDIKKQMDAYFAIPDPSMLADFRRVRATEGDMADLRPVLKNYIDAQLPAQAKEQL